MYTYTSYCMYFHLSIPLSSSFWGLSSFWCGHKTLGLWPASNPHESFLSSPCHAKLPGAIMLTKAFQWEHKRGKGPSEFHVDTCEQKFTFHFQVIFAAITLERMVVNKMLLVTIKEKQIPAVILTTTMKHWIHLIYNQVIPSSIFPVSHLTIFNGTI